MVKNIEFNRVNQETTSGKAGGQKKYEINALTFLSKKSYSYEKTIFTIFKDSDPVADLDRYDCAGRNGRRYFICRYRELELNCVA
jgi:hypothetical protein